MSVDAMLLSLNAISLLVDTMPLSGDAMLLSVNAIPLLVDTMPLSGDAMLLSGNAMPLLVDTMPLQVKRFVLYTVVGKERVRVSAGGVSVTNIFELVLLQNVFCIDNVYCFHKVMNKLIVTVGKAI
ncbi:hypothetical protein [Nostoc sp.]|uniref:hypothetical protein n=1 Tax=Nostoc sp. TaxID=1180 RepID=UPI002FF671E5